MTFRSITLALLPLLGACGMGGAGPLPGFAPPAPVLVAPPPPSANGAIFQQASGYAGLHEGQRARQVGDLVTVVLVESIGTSKSTSAQTAKGGSFGVTPPSAGPLSFLNPEALKAASDSSFKGGGSAAQRSTLNGAVAVTITEVRPGGTALVAGERHMSLSQGKEWVQFAGIVRLADIGSDNRVLSTQVADARIIYSGQGAIQQASKPGWLSRFFNFVSPF